MSQECHVCHAFYSSLYESAAFRESKLGCRYKCFSAPDIPPQLQLEQALLRLTLLEQESGSDQLNIPNGSTADHKRYAQISSHVILIVIFLFFSLISAKI